MAGDIATAVKDAEAAGFTGQGLVTAVAVSGAESGWGANPIGHNPGSTDWGYWQINDAAHPNYNPTQLLNDPQYNAAAAFAISSGGSNWSPWTTYTSGAYVKYLDQAKAAIAAGGGTLVDSASSVVGTLAAFIFPLAAGTYTVGQAYGGPGGHPGVDLPAAAGTPIYAAASGTIKSVGGDPTGFGNDYPVETLADGTTLTYGHAEKSYVKAGQAVKAGQVIAQVGSEGDSTGAHLHFQVNGPGGALEDPLAWLTGHGAGTADTAAQLLAGVSGTVGGGSSDTFNPLSLSSYAHLFGELFFIAIKGVLVAAGGALMVIGVASAAGKSTSLPIPIPV